MKKLISLFAVLLLLTALVPAALAESMVEYYDYGSFVFTPGSEYSATDLFENFKNVLPGDVLTQQVVVRNSSQSDTRIWMQQTPAAQVETEQTDFLEQLHLTVTMEGRTLFDSQASESAQLTERVLLGFFPEHPRGETVLDVTLTVPSDLGNEYQGQIGVVPWTFIVQEIPNDNTPDTGDWFEIAAWVALAGALLLAIIAVLLMMRKRKAAN